MRRNGSSYEEFNQVGALFDDYFRSIGQLNRFKQQMAMTYWPHIVGERVAGHARPIRTQNGIIFIEVDSSAWQNELQYMKRDIVGQLNRFLRGNYIKDIKFLAGRH